MACEKLSVKTRTELDGIRPSVRKVARRECYGFRQGAGQLTSKVVPRQQAPVPHERHQQARYRPSRYSEPILDNCYAPGVLNTCYTAIVAFCVANFTLVAAFQPASFQYNTSFSLDQLLMDELDDRNIHFHNTPAGLSLINMPHASQLEDGPCEQKNLQHPQPAAAFAFASRS